MSKQLIGSILASLLFVATAALVLLNLQRIHDTLQYYKYTPDTTMAAFVADTGMSDHGQFLFYASHPVLSDATTFQAQCGAPEAAAAILGCYDGVNIYIFDVTDPRLAGIRPTTAAHEMLHAAYKRLDQKDKQYINGLLEAEYERLKDDEELAGKIAFYDRAQPGDRVNELHSILGTEFAELRPELETYYAKYFTDRSKVVAQHAQYRTLFEELKDRANRLRVEKDAVGQEIEAQQASFTARSTALEAQISAFNRRADTGDFDSQAEFSRERGVLLAEIASLDQLRMAIDSSVARYNQLVAELNSIATETNSLTSSMDSTTAPVPRL